MEVGTAAARWSLAGRLALVTGATLGIGLAVAEAFLSLGATVLAVARDAERLEGRRDGWGRRGARALVHPYAAGRAGARRPRADVEDSLAHAHAPRRRARRGRGRRRLPLDARRLLRHGPMHSD